MPSFCGVISRDESTSDTQPFRFPELCLLTDFLINETKVMEEEFERRNECLKEQQRRIMLNETNLENINAQMNILTEQVAVLDNELGKHDQIAAGIDKAIDVCEDVLNGDYRNLNLLPGRQDRVDQQRNTFANLVQHMDIVVNDLKSIGEDLQDYEKYFTVEKKCENKVLQLLELHVRILECTEKNLNKLLQRSIDVDEKINDMLKQNCTDAMVNPEKAAEALMKITNSINEIGTRKF